MESLRTLNHQSDSRERLRPPGPQATLDPNSLSKSYGNHYRRDLILLRSTSTPKE
ncbi:MAG: hypothetical protein WBP93_22910 [Pyrinomonadaceae bacterium]